MCEVWDGRGAGLLFLKESFKKMHCNTMGNKEPYQHSVAGIESLSLTDKCMCCVFYFTKSTV